MATFQWGGKTWGIGDLDKFMSYLASKGTDYGTWAINHAGADSILRGGSTPSDANSTGGYGAPPPEPQQGKGTPTDANSTSSGYNAPGTSPAVSQIGAVDWSALLGLYGLPDDIVNELNRIFSTSGNVDQAITLAQAYVRGTPWYARTYPNIQTGINSGLFQDEKGYMAYKNQVNQLYQQYWKRDATTGEISGYLSKGWNASRVAADFQSQATQANFSDPLKALLTPDELKALADQQAGIDTALGQHVTQIANLYSQVRSMYRDFYGREPGRDELDELVKNGASPQDIAKQFSVQSNIAGMNPAIRDLFTPEEIKQVATEEAGGSTPDGQHLKSLMDLALQLNPIYHQYTGAGVSRQEIEQSLTSGLTPSQTGQQLSGTAWEKANEGDIQQTSGAFGDTGQLTPDQLKALGFQEGGFDTPLGQQLALAYQKANQRMAGVFKGVLASPALSLANGRLAGQSASRPPDTAA